MNKWLSLYEIKKNFNRSIWKIKNSIGPIHNSPTFLLGNQKTGSTAIAALLAESVNEPVVLDIFFKIPYNSEQLLLEEKISFEKFVNKNRTFFRNKLIKEPGLSFWVDEIQDVFKNPRFVFLLRDPRDNIRSILNRLKVPGNLPQLRQEQEKELPGYIWKMIIEGSAYGTKGQNYIETQALRWKKILQIYEKNKDSMILIKYEDFVKDKANTIYELSIKLGLKNTVDISERVDVQYQPRGTHYISWEEFYEKENLQCIEKICRQLMKKYNYQLYY